MWANLPHQMDWITLETVEDWNEAFKNSDESPIVVFKHSTRCSISRMALKLTEQRWDLPDNVRPLLLDLLSHREVSQAIASDLSIEHQSPQLIFVSKGKALHHANHSAIDPVELKPYL